ncbi:MAG: RidA family protein [Thermomicrobiales bacterium]
MRADNVTVRHLNPDTMPKPYGYSQIVEVTGGRTVYISGQVPLDENNDLVGLGDFEAQARQTFENVHRALEAVGLTFAHVVKVQMYLTDMENLLALRTVRDEFVNTAQPPASTAVAVSALFRPDVLFELDVIAVG